MQKQMNYKANGKEIKHRTCNVFLSAQAQHIYMVILYRFLWGALIILTNLAYSKSNSSKVL